MINPDGSLSNAEKRILSFLKERQVNWPGINSEDPTSEKFCSILENNNIILYAPLYAYVLIYLPNVFDLY